MGQTPEESEVPQASSHVEGLSDDPKPFSGQRRQRPSGLKYRRSFLMIQGRAAARGGGYLTLSRKALKAS